MSAYVYDKILMESEDAAKKLIQNNWPIWPIQRFIVRGIRPKRFDQDDLCFICEQRVQRLETTSELFGKMVVVPSTCNTCRVKAFEQHEEEERQQVFLRAYAKCGGYQNRPALFRGKEVKWEDIRSTFDFQKSLIEYAEQIIDGDFRGCSSLFITGPTGTGKTFLSKLIHNEFLKQFKNSCFIKAVELAILIRKIGMDREAGHILNELRHVETLIVDDYGTQKNTEWVKEAVFSIFDYRYDNKKRTILTTNLMMGDITDDDPRLASRFRDSSWMRYLQIHGNDLRL